jgi:hypothetical protein
MATKKLSGRGDDQEARPTSDSMLAIFLVALATRTRAGLSFPDRSIFRAGRIACCHEAKLRGHRLPSKPLRLVRTIPIKLQCLIPDANQQHELPSVPDLGIITFARAG